MCVCDHIMLIVLTHTVCLCCVFSPRQVDSNIVNILRQRKLECMQWEGPDAKYKCKKVSDDYDEAATNWFIKCNFILSSSSIVIACLNFYCCWCCCCLWPILFPIFLAFWEWLLFNSQMMVAGRCSLLPYDMAVCHYAWIFILFFYLLFNVLMDKLYWRIDIGVYILFVVVAFCCSFTARAIEKGITSTKI